MPSGRKCSVLIRKVAQAVKLIEASSQPMSELDQCLFTQRGHLDPKRAPPDLSDIGLDIVLGVVGFPGLSVAGIP